LPRPRRWRRSAWSATRRAGRRAWHADPQVLTIPLPTRRPFVGCCGPPRTSASASCTAAPIGRRRPDATGLPAGAPHPRRRARRRPVLAIVVVDDPQATGLRRSRWRLAAGVGRLLVGSTSAMILGRATAAMARRVGPRGAGRPGRPGPRARRPRARSSPHNRPRRRGPPYRGGGAGARPVGLVPSSTQRSASSAVCGLEPVSSQLDRSDREPRRARMRGVRAPHRRTAHTAHPL
jgi:hypothetical protein